MEPVVLESSSVSGEVRALTLVAERDRRGPRVPQPASVRPLTRRRLCEAGIIAIVAFVLHAPFVLSGFGEPDAVRLAVYAASWREHGEFVDVGSYTYRVSPAYLYFLRAALDRGVPLSAVPSVMNWTSACAGSFAVALLYLLCVEWFGSRTALGAVVLTSASPAFWLANIYGMPHLPSFAFFLLSLLFLSRATVQEAARGLAVGVR